MLVTVVTPVTGNPLMRQAIASVQNQTYQNIEHLIVIDGEEREAEARAILAEMDLTRHKTHILCLPYATGKNRFNGHRIYGMAPFLINGDFICYLDEDNWYDPHHVESLIKVTVENNLDWAYALRKIVDKDGNFACLDDCESLGKWAHRDIYYQVDTNCYFLKKNIAIEFSATWYAKFREKIGTNSYIYTPDKAMCMQLLEKYPKVETTGTYSVNYRLGGSESSVSLEFFYQHNQLKQQQYPKGFPWRKVKLRDISLPRQLTETADKDKYGEAFFHEVKTSAQESAKAVLPYLWQVLDGQVRSVVDVGCGMGSWLAQVSSLFQIDDILGIDGDYVKTTELDIPVDRFLAHDLGKPLSLERRFDLVISLEVAEYLSSALADDFVSTLAGLGEMVLFSAAIPLQPGTNHINTQFPHYWLALFERRGYKCLDCLREQFWQDSRVEWWYAQNMLLFVKEEVLRENQKLLSLHQQTDLEKLVRIHPQNIQSKIAFGHDDTIVLKTTTSIIPEENKHSQHQELLLKIFDKSPYENFPYHDYPCDLQGWGSKEPIFERLITQVKPKLIIEVGTWKGASAVHMVDVLKSRNIDCSIICVDTWLGGIETFKGNPIMDIAVRVPRKYGYCELYFQFLANVMHKQAEKYLVPLPVPSNLAYKLIDSWQVGADLIYIDGSHEEEDVYADLMNFWKILSPNGILLGDDYGEFAFPGVLVAVHRFAKEKNLTIHSEGRKFWFVKPPSPEDAIAVLTRRIAELELRTNPDVDLSYFA